MNIAIMDMNALAFRREGGRVTVSTTGFPELACVQVPDTTSDREAIFRVLDAVLAGSRVPVGDDWLAVGLLNPLSGEVAVGPVPATVAFRADAQVVIPAGGLLATVDGDLLTLADGTALTAVPATVDEVERALAAHRA